jgi:hypothetical protein
MLRDTIDRTCVICASFSRLGVCTLSPVGTGVEICDVDALGVALSNGSDVVEGPDEAYCCNRDTKVAFRRLVERPFSAHFLRRSLRLYSWFRIVGIVKIYTVYTMPRIKKKIF